MAQYGTEQTRKTRVNPFLLEHLGVSFILDVKWYMYVHHFTSNMKDIAIHVMVKCLAYRLWTRLVIVEDQYTHLVNTNTRIK